MGETFKPSAEQQKEPKMVPIQEVPFRKATKEALINWPPITTEAEALKIIETQTNTELENARYATESMKSSLKGIIKCLQERNIGTSDINPDELYADIFGPEEPTAEVSQTGALVALGEKINSLEAPEALIVDTLSTIHDDWSRGNARKFFQREKKYQHIPLELIGWKEAKADLLFLNPILEGAGVEINEDQIQFSYYERVADFQEKRGISTKEGLISAIQQAEVFYPALEGQIEITDFMKTPEGAATVASQIIEKGIGADADYQAYLDAKAEQTTSEAEA